jgi:hypothetical protein
MGAGDDSHRRIVALRQADDELDVAVDVSVHELLAEAADESERGRVAVGDHGAEAKDSLLAGEHPQLGDEAPAETPSLPLVHDLEGDLGLRRAFVADEASDADRPARLQVDRGHGFTPAAADVDEMRDVALEQPRLRAEKAQPAASTSRRFRSAST